MDIFGKMMVFAIIGLFISSSFIQGVAGINVFSEDLEREIPVNTSPSWRIRTLGWNHVNEEATAVELRGSLGILFSMGLYDVGFRWGKTSSVINRVGADDYGILNTFSSNIYNLNRKETYYFKAIGQHKNTGITYDGFLFSFKPGYISIGTDEATNIDYNSATLNGYLSHMGGASSCQIWFQYGSDSENLDKKVGFGEKTSTGPFSTMITNLESGQEYYFQAVGSNDCGTIHGIVQNFTTSGIPNNDPPQKPETPSGPTSTVSNVDYSYSTSSVDPENDNVRYGWDWNGDDIIDEWTEFFESGQRITSFHDWTSAGTFFVKVVAEDEHGTTSSYSDPLEVVTIENQPPNNPNSEYIRIKNELVIKTIDPDGDQVRCGISWDNDQTVDHWTNLVNSDTEQRIECVSSQDKVGIIAEDEHGVQSEWVSQQSKDKNQDSSVLDSVLADHPKIDHFLRWCHGSDCWRWIESVIGNQS